MQNASNEITVETAAPPSSAVVQVRPVAATVAADGVPVGAAKGDDDMMSVVPPPVSSEATPALNLWTRQIDAAHATWDKLTLLELIPIEGVEHRLIALVQQRYGLTRVRATRQVKTFFEEQRA